MEGKMKKNRIKRIGKWSVSLLLALVLTTSAFSVPAFAQDPDLATLQDLIEESETVVKKPADQDKSQRLHERFLDCIF